MRCYRKKISKMNSRTLRRRRAIVSIVLRSSFKARKEAFLREFSCMCEQHCISVPRRALTLSLCSLFGKWIIVSSTQEARRQCCVTRREGYSGFLEFILQLARLTSSTLSAAMQQPFITDFNSHTHEFFRQSYRLIGTFETDFRVFCNIHFRHIGDVYLWNYIPDSDRLLNSKINKYKPHELKWNSLGKNAEIWRIFSFCKILPKN